MIFNQAMPSIGGGGGGGHLYVFSEVTFLNTNAEVSNTYMAPKSAYTDDALVSGATVKFYTYGDYILDTITGVDSGNTVPFSTISRGQYTFTMPDESVHCTLLYDD